MLVVIWKNRIELFHLASKFGKPEMVPDGPRVLFHQEVGSTMSTRFTVGACTLAALVVTGVLAADAPLSGPQTGKSIPGAFHPLNVTGPKAGQKNCLV